MTANAQKETVHFQAEVKQLLKLMIHSLYSNKEIFVRELISNASDALDKLRFESLAKPELSSEEGELQITVDFDADKKTVTFKDNGIGMTRDEVIQNLGTIAKSGTREFFDNLTGDAAKDSQLIGQFGVGFYSAFIVAKEVVVKTRKAGQPQDAGVLWRSKAEGDYELEATEMTDRGTEITLYLKDEEFEFANGYRLRHIIKTYSDHISFPVVMKKEEPPKTEADKQDEDVIDVSEPEFEVVNEATALWALPKEQIDEEKYKEFYKHVAHDFEDPLNWSHNRVEGKLEYTSLLYVPGRAPFDMWQPGKARGLKLYVQRVFIMDEVEQFLPNYLRFIKGIIDSNDLPLNVSREILQGNRVIDSMRSALVKRVLGMLSDMAKKDKEKYQKFWKEFGQVLKEGPAEDFTNKEEIAKLLRFASTHENTEEQTISLEDYVARMKPEQEKIYYVTAETFNAAKNSPHLEIFRKKGIEVLLLTDRVDEWLMAHLTEFSGKPFQSVAKGDLNLGKMDESSEKEANEENNSDYDDCIAKMKTILGDRVKDVRLTKRLTDSPACVVADENDMSAQMERIMKAAGQHVPASKPILELNPDHMILQRLKGESSSERFEEWTQILCDQAILAEGGQLEDPASFVKRFNALLLEFSK